MSENQPKEIENLKTSETSQNKPETNLQIEHQPTGSKEQSIDIEDVRAKLLEQPDTPPALPYDDSPEGNQPQYIDRIVKSESLKKELELIRSRLPFSQSIFSKATHQPLISRSSDLSAKTIARPSGLLGGGILAFCGSLAYLLFSKYVGMRYNYLVFVFLFVLGYGISIAVELLLSSLRSKTK